MVSLRLIATRSVIGDGTGFLSNGLRRRLHMGPDRVATTHRVCCAFVLHRCVLLPGDVERRAELALVLVGTELGADVLVSPHHGSRTSSTAEFISAVSPSWVIHSVSLNNRFGFPHESVIRRYATLNVRQLTTAKDGAVEIYLSSEGELTVDAYKHRALRFWHRFATGNWLDVEP